MNTVIVNRMVYRIGAIYLFKDTKTGDSELGVLDAVDAEAECGRHFRSRSGNKTEWFHICEAVRYPIGYTYGVPPQTVTEVL